MAKLTEKKFNEYKQININGFKVDLHKLMYQFAHGDEYPQMRLTILNTETEQIIITVSFFKFYGGTGEYTIKANQFKKSSDPNNRYMIGGTGKFEKVYHLEETDAKTKFSFKHIQELCSKFDIEEFTRTILNDYEIYKNTRMAV